MAGGFRESNAPRYDRFIHQLPEVRANLLVDLMDQVISTIKHRQDDSADRQRWIQRLPHTRDRADKVGQSF